MAWFKVDDKFHSSEEVMSIPFDQRAAAIGLWTLAGAWSADQLKDGFVPVTHLSNWGGSTDLASVLVKAKLWTRVGSKGFQFRNWEKWQTTRADVDERQSAWREKKAEQRAARAANTGRGPQGVQKDTSGSPQGVLSFPSRPVPSLPNQRQTPTSSVSNGDDDQSYPQGSAYAELIRAAKAELEAQGNEEVDTQSAMAVVDEILERGGKRVRNPTAYVHRALTGESGQGWVTFAHGGRMPE